MNLSHRLKANHIPHLLLIVLGLCGCTNEIPPTQGLQSINGSNLYLHVFGKGVPLVVVHGGPGMNHTYFLPHLKSLAKDFTVILYDQRSSGKSASASKDSLSLDFFIEDIEAIRKHYGLKKINLLGHSWGALPAIQYGLNYPDQVKTLILCNPVALSHEFDTEIASIQKSRVTKTDSIDRAAILSSSEFIEGKSSAMEELMLMAFRHSFFDSEKHKSLNMELPPNFNQASGALYGGLGKDLAQYNYYDSISKIKFPVLVLYGASDAIPTKAMHKIKSSLPSAKIVPFNESGHFIFIEEPESFKAELIGFIKR